MGFGEAIKTCFQKYFVFQGRAQRSEYWFFVLFTTITGIILSIVDVIIFGLSMGLDISPLDNLFSLATFIPSIAVCCRRLHDIDKSGWWQLIPGIGLLLMIPAIAPAISRDFDSGLFIGSIGIGALVLIGLSILLLVWLCTDSERGPNRFGDSPKYGSVADTFS